MLVVLREASSTVHGHGKITAILPNSSRTAALSLNHQLRLHAVITGELAKRTAA